MLNERATYVTEIVVTFSFRKSESKYALDAEVERQASGVFFSYPTLDIIISPPPPLWLEIYPQYINAVQLILCTQHMYAFTMS